MYFYLFQVCQTNRSRKFQRGDRDQHHSEEWWEVGSGWEFGWGCVRDDALRGTSGGSAVQWNHQRKRCMANFFHWYLLILAKKKNCFNTVASQAQPWHVKCCSCIIRELLNFLLIFLKYEHWGTYSFFQILRNILAFCIMLWIWCNKSFICCRLWPWPVIMWPWMCHALSSVTLVTRCQP